MSMHPDDLERELQQWRPARRLRYEAVETFRFRDPQSGATIQIEVPREDVVLVALDPI